MAAPTGVAVFNVEEHTLNSYFNLPTKSKCKDMDGDHLNRLQQSLSEVKYLIIAEMFMVGRKLFGQAAFNVEEHTLHSYFNLPTTSECKDMEGDRLNQLQQSLYEVKYVPNHC